MFSSVAAANVSLPPIPIHQIEHTSESIDWRPGTLRDLGDDGSGTSCSRHDVGKRFERTGSFAVWRRWFTVVDVLARRPSSVLGVAGECSLGLSDSGLSSGSG
jgi:hypothetical protein